MNLKRYIFIQALSLIAMSSIAQVIADYRTIPLPDSIELSHVATPFTLGGDVSIQAPVELKREADFLRSYLPTGLKGPSSGSIELRADLKSDNPEAYTITTTPYGIVINGATPAGTFYGIQTLRKAIPTTTDASGIILIPSGTVTDKPRFSYRGVHLDVARHFFTVDEVKTFLDMAALHGANRFHWHLTDDQGWRIESKKYPRLTEIGSYRANSIIGREGPGYDDVPVSGFYTQEEIKDIIQYAADRHIMIIPEVDLPGHMEAAMAAYPELGCTGGPYEVWNAWGVNEDVLCPGKDVTMQFIAGILNEVMDLFPGPYFNIGGDECPKNEWKKCPHCQARIKELGLVEKDGVNPEAQLQGYVTQFACDVVRKHGKSAIGWDEILECDIPEDAIILSWRGIDGAMEGTKRGHRAILSPNSHCYFDFYQTKDTQNEPFAIGGLTTVERVYSFDPAPDTMTPEQKALVLGCQSNMWTEYIASFPHVQYMELPRLAALSEVQWTDPSKKDFQDFKTRVPAMMAMYDKLGYKYAKHIADVDVKYNIDTDKHALIMSCSALPGYKIRYTLDGSKPTAMSTLYTDPVPLEKDCIVSITTFKDGIEGRPVCDTLSIGKLTFEKCKLAVEPDAGYYFNGEEQLVDGLSGTNNYRTGRWLGFSGKNCDATIELSKPQTLSEVSFNVCVFTCDGLFDCREAEVYGQTDGSAEMKLLARAEYPEMPEGDTFAVSNHVLTFDPVTVTKLRVVIKPQWIIPKWHYLCDCYGFLFVDEIQAR